MNSESSDSKPPSELSDGDLLEAIHEAYRETFQLDDQADRLTAFNHFHDLRKEAADRGLRSDASEVTEQVRQEEIET